MRIALLNGFVGSVLVIWLGQSFLNLEFRETILCILAANIGILATLFGTLRIQKTAIWSSQVRFKKTKSWLIAGILFIGVLSLIAPQMRNIENLTSLFLPLLLSTGFGILIFGPIQDQLVRRQQRQARLAPEMRLRK